MAQQFINVGASPNDGTGDPVRTAFTKCNDNFSQLYSRVQVNAPATAAGEIGDEFGMYAVDDSWFYICIGNYDGSTEIWRRVAVATW